MAASYGAMRVKNLNQQLARLASELKRQANADALQSARLLYRTLADPRRIFAQLCPVLCPGCEEDCCRRVSHRGVMDTADLVFLAQQGITSLPESERQDGLCPWLGPKGCILAWNARPFACLHYLCEPLQDAMSQEELDVVRTSLAQAGEMRSHLLKLFMGS